MSGRTLLHNLYYVKLISKNDKKLSCFNPVLTVTVL